MNDTCLFQFVYESIPAGRKVISTNEKGEHYDWKSPKLIYILLLLLLIYYVIKFVYNLCILYFTPYCNVH